jgi:hypothetical protein
MTSQPPVVASPQSVLLDVSTLQMLLLLQFNQECRECSGPVPGRVGPAGAAGAAGATGAAGLGALARALGLCEADVRSVARPLVRAGLFAWNQGGAEALAINFNFNFNSTHLKVARPPRARRVPPAEAAAAAEDAVFSGSPLSATPAAVSATALSATQPMPPAPAAAAAAAAYAAAAAAGGGNGPTGSGSGGAAGSGSGGAAGSTGGGSRAVPRGPGFGRFGGGADSLTQAALVRQMKRWRRCSHESLRAAVEAQLRGGHAAGRHPWLAGADPAALRSHVKRNVETLLEKEYMERAGGLAAPEYVYLP